MAKRLLVGLVILACAVGANAAITWEAHYNDGSYDADYVSHSVVGPSPWVATSALVDTGYTGGAIAPSYAGNTQLDYPIWGPDVNLASGTMSVRVRPTYGSDHQYSSGNLATVLSVGRAASGTANGERFIRLYYNAGWKVQVGKLDNYGSTQCYTISATPFSYAADEWLHFGLAWEQSTGDLTLYVNGAVDQTVSAGAGYWATSGNIVPDGVSVGNIRYASTVGDEYFGTIDDVVFSDVYQDTAIFTRVPEPATMGLLTFGAAMALIRRRK